MKTLIRNKYYAELKTDNPNIHTKRNLAPVEITNIIAGNIYSSNRRAKKAKNLQFAENTNERRNSHISTRKSVEFHLFSTSFLHGTALK